MTNKLGIIADFVIKIIIVFTTVVTLLFLAGRYPIYSFTFSFLALIFVLAIITKSMVDIFSKD